MKLEYLSRNKAFGGEQFICSHRSQVVGTDMTFSVYVPPHEQGTKLPVLWYLSGLTCTHANVTEKGEYRAACAQHGIAFIAPDTSPRGNDVPDARDEYDFGQGAGFYVDATQPPYNRHYQMRSYIENELPALAEKHFPIDLSRQGIMGHSMGGHGALTLGLRDPARFHSISAFAPIVAPSRVPWGEKAFSRYLGDNRNVWRAYDAVALVEDGARHDHILVDQGTADQFLEEQLKTDIFSLACAKAGMAPEIRMQEGYDHSYYFISTFMSDHVAWHAERLGD